jgi:hypothetical protein
MTAKPINKKLFEQAIRVGFEGDKDIYSLYCPHVTVENVDDIVRDISGRVSTGVANATLKGLYEKNELVGYYAYEGQTLISFSLNVKYRTRKYLKGVWQNIRKDLHGRFQCFLWSRNIRGCKWLEKNGMKIIAQDNLITHLIF